MLMMNGQQLNEYNYGDRRIPRRSAYSGEYGLSFKMPCLTLNTAVGPMFVGDCPEQTVQQTLTAGTLPITTTSSSDLLPYLILGGGGIAILLYIMNKRKEAKLGTEKSTTLTGYYRSRK